MVAKFTRKHKKHLTRKKYKYRGGNRPWALVQYDNRPIPEHYKKLIEVNKEYCKKYNYEHILRTDPFDLPPWWVKVKICRELLNSNKYNGVMWLDTDVGIFDCSRSLDEFTKDPKMHFFISPDPPSWEAPVNAGVWMVKNTTVGNDIMNTWMSLYDKTKWVKNTKLNPPPEDILIIDPKLSYFERLWAGINFEQGALYYNIVRNPKFKGSINVLPNIILSYWKPSKKDGSFTGHYFRNIKSHEKNDNKYYIENFLRERIRC